jgi:dihydropteroate synthase
MGVLNVTPDSFSDGGRFASIDAAVAHGVAMLDEGADVIDVGGESTRPGADPVGESDEADRVLPVIAELASEVAARGARLSIDTRHASVARAAVSAGAHIINDVSASLAPVAAETGAGWIAMHMAGVPRTMQVDPGYDDVVAEVTAYLVARAEDAVGLGVSEVWIDPGIGFGKTAAHNLALLGSIDRVVATGWPVAVGTSRKATMGRLVEASDRRVGALGDGEHRGPLDRLEASLATATWAMQQGAAMIRVHDVRPHVHAAAVVAGTIADPATSPVRA